MMQKYLIIIVIQKKFYDKQNHGFFKMPKHRSIDINDLSEIKIISGLFTKK